MLNKKNRAKLSVWLMCVSASLIFAGCGQSAPSQHPAQPAAPAPSSQPASTEPTATKASKPLVVYLNDFDEIIGPMFEKETGYKLEIVSGNGAEILSRIEAEKGNPHWDVVWIDSMPSVHRLAKSGQLLEEWTPGNLGEMKDSFKKMVPANKSYYPTGAHAAGVLIYNTKAVDAVSAPKAWKELSDPRFKDQVGMADPAIAAPAYPFVSWFFNDQGMDGGKAYFDQLMKNGARIYPKNPNVAKSLTSGEIKLAALQESNAYALKNAGEPVEIIWPVEGAPAAVRVAGIQKETKNQEAAKAFVEFILDPKVQQQLIEEGEESYFEPSAADVESKKDRPADAKLVVADPEWASENEAEIKQWFADQAVK